MEIGQKIKKAREEINLSQSELGIRAGITFQQISSWECGLRIPKLESIVKIAKALKINPHQLLPDWFVEEEKKWN